MNIVTRGFTLNEIKEMGLPKNENELWQFSSSLSWPIDFERYWKNFNHLFYSVFIDYNYLGHFEIKNINYKLDIATGAHILLADNQRRKGFGKYLVNQLNKKAFEQGIFHRLNLTVACENKAAVKCYIESGYKIEGIIRELLVSPDGQRHDAYQMGLLRTEWKPLSS